MLGVAGFAGVVYAAPTQTFLRNTLPEANNTYDLGSTSPNLRWKNIYTTDLNVSGTCTGCGGGGSLSGGSPNTLTYWVNGTTVSATSSPTVGYIVATSTTATSTFAGGLQVNGGTLTVDASGNFVGVGTASPETKLNIVSTSQDLLKLRRSSTSLNDSARIQFSITTVPGVAASYLEAIRSDVSGGNDIAFGTSLLGGAATEKIRFRGNGNIGIGTTTPTSKLSVNGDLTTIATSSGKTQVWKIQNLNFADRARFVYDSANVDLALNYPVTNTDIMNWDLNGNLVGIATSTPYATLSVTNTQSNPSFVVEDSTSPDSSPFIIDSAGDVMIGTTTNPSSYKLTVQGTGNAANFVGPTYFHSLNEPTATIRGIVITGNVFSGDNNIEAYNNSGGKFTFNSRNTGNGTSTAAIMMDPSSRYISFHTATSSNAGSLGSWANEQMRLTGQGFLGLGTTSPGQKLSVAGDILGNNLIGTYFTATSTTATSTFANGINLSGGCFAINNTCVSGAGGGGSGTVNTGVANYFAYYPSGGTTVDDQTVLNIVSGNVGIGTTTPSKLLAVGGDILGNNIIGSYFTATSTLATSTFYGPVDASSLTVRRPRASRGLLLGDSTTAAYLGMSGIDTFLATSSDTVLGTQITNDAVAGDTISQQQTAWTNDTNKAKYDWIMVMVGLNDYASATSTIISDYQTLINTINSGKKESAVIIVATTLPAKQRYIDLLGQSAGLQAFSKVSALNEAVMGGGSTPITGVSFRINKHYNALSDGAGNLALAYDSGDGIHENNLGRQLIAKVFRESLNNIGYLTNTPSGIVSDYWVNNGPSIYLKSANPTINTTNLGIGTTSPGTLLSVGSIANFATTSSAMYVPLKVTNTGTGNSFTVEDSASDTSPFVVDASGNVGVGTASPSYLEHLLVTTNSENGLMIENNNGGTSAGAAFYLKNNAGTIGGMNVLSSNHVASWLAGQTNLLSQSGLTLVSSSNVQNGGTSPITFYTGGWDYTNERMRLTSTGLGIATTSPWRKLSVVGGVAFNGLTSSTAGNAVCILTNFDVVTAGGTTCTTSSAKTKHNILTINESTARKIMKLRPVEYTTNESVEERYGFIAEEVAEVDPKLVEYAKSDITLFDGQIIKKGEPLSVDYNRYTGLLTKFVQDIYTSLQKLIAKVAGLETKLNKQQKEIDLLKVEIENLKANINK